MNYKGKVIKCKGLGKKIGFPTANLELKDKDNLPEHGIYAGYVLIGQDKYKGAIFYGPVDEKVALEVHILDFNQDLYGQEIEIEFVKKIREVKKFENNEDLKKQIEKVCRHVEIVLK